MNSESMNLEFSDVIAKEAFENWGDDRNIDAIERLRLHLEEKFGAASYSVTSVVEREDFLMLEISSSKWDRTREFGFDGGGRLFW